MNINMLFFNSFNSSHGYEFTICIKKYLVNVVRRLKVKNIWQYLEPPVRGWLDLACKLRGIKFRSREVLLVLCKILNRIKTLLDFPGLMAAIGIRYAWRVSQLAASWGNKDAEMWRHDKAFSFYCGLTLLQVFRVLPLADLPELYFLQDIIQDKVFRRILRLFGKML